MRRTLACLMILALLTGCDASTGNGSSAYRESSGHSEYSQNSEYDAPEVTEETPALILLHEETAQMHADLPAFSFEAYCSEDNRNFITDLHVVDTETNELVTAICLIDYMVYWDVPMGVPTEFYGLELVDVNFDGYKDIRVFAGYNGNWRKDYIYFLWDPDADTLIDEPHGLRDLGLPSFDEENQLIRSMVRGSAADHWFYTHRYLDGRLVTIEEVADTAIWEYKMDDSASETLKALAPLYEEGTSFQHYTRKELDMDTMELVVVEDIYQLRDSREYAVLAEFAVDSEVGLLLAEYE